MVAVPDEIRSEPLSKALAERYLAYALSTITQRALPDVRDGLKPVHRRILYGMRLLRLDPDSAFKKSAKVVGDVMGSFHPHGDQAIYDALVRLAQEFSVRYPLVDGQGNFGNVDGDNAAAMRYTESRLTAVAQALLDGLDENAVDFRTTYDGETREPVVLPAAFPNLLANGSNGIAVGMATNIPPHNAGELCDAALHLIKFPNATADKLVDFVPGPDLPTGGIIVEDPASMAEAYKTGRGGFRVRARWEKEEGARGTYQIVVTEIPYQVQKSKLIERIAELLEQKKLPLLDDIHDESAEDIRIVLTPKSRVVEPEILMEQLFRASDLETRIPLNMNVLDKGLIPRVMSLKDVLAAFAAHRREVLERRSTFRLEKIAARLEVLEGYLAVFLNLDKVIKIIRTEDEPTPKLMKAFSLTEVQADAILNMRLRSLRKLEEMELRRERDTLIAEREELSRLIESPTRQRTRLKKDLAALRARYGPDTELGRRRTLIEEAGPARDIPLEAMIEREPITVIMSQRGWIRAMKGHVDRSEADALKFKEGDGGRFFFHAHTTDKLLLAVADGRFYTLAADRLPGGRGFGEPVKLMVDVEGEGNIVTLFRAATADKLLLATSDGRGFVTSAAGAVAETRKGKQVVNLRPGARLKSVRPVGEGHDYVGVIGENRKLVVYPLSELPEMGRGQGVQLQRYRDGGLADVTSFRFADGLSWPMGGESGRTRTEPDMNPWRAARGAAGRMPPTGFPKDKPFG